MQTSLFADGTPVPTSPDEAFVMTIPGVRFFCKSSPVDECELSHKPPQTLEEANETFGMPQPPPISLYVRESAPGAIYLSNERLVFVSNPGWLWGGPGCNGVHSIPLASVRAEAWWRGIFGGGGRRLTGLSTRADTTDPRAGPLDWTITFAHSDVRPEVWSMFQGAVEKQLGLARAAAEQARPAKPSAAAELAEKTAAPAEKAAEPKGWLSWAMSRAAAPAEAAAPPAWLRELFDGVQGVDDALTRAAAWCESQGYGSLQEVREAGAGSELVASTKLPRGKAAIITKRLQ